jgi:hypothetical protein
MDAFGITDIDDITDVEEILVPTRKQIPIELPPPPDLSNLPSHILHSGTVETLIGQNDDLMARLKVNIRRNSLFEQKILELENSNIEMTRANSSLLSQIQIYEEKDLIVREKLMTSTVDHEKMKEEIASQAVKISNLEQRNSDLRLAARYLRRVRRWVTPFVDKLKTELAREGKNLLGKEAIISDLRARLVETVNYAQNVERQSMKDQAALVERYEATHRKMQTDLEKATATAKLLRDKANRVEQAVAESAGYANRIIYLDRHSEDLRAQLTAQQRAMKLLEAELVNARHSQKNELQLETLSSSSPVASAPVPLINRKSVDAVRDSHEYSITDLPTT